MKTKTKIIRVIENIHMPTVIKSSLPNWINGSNSKTDDSGTSSSSTSSLPSDSSSTYHSKQKQKSRSKMRLNKPTKITTIENLNAPSRFNTTPEISSKYSKDFISKAFIDTFSNKLSTEKRTIILDELLHKCSPEELHLLKILIDKNLSETSLKNLSDDFIPLKNKKKNMKKEMNNDKQIYSFNSNNNSNNIYERKNSSLIKDNDYQSNFNPLSNNPITEIENDTNSYHKQNKETIININRNQNKSPLDNYINNNINGRKTSLANLPFSSKNSNETLINESIWSTKSQILGYHQYLNSSENMLSSFYPVQTNYNDFCNYRNTNSFDYSSVNIKPFINNTSNNSLINSNKKSGSLFDKLADELLIRIFSYLDTQSLAYASQVNCRWYSLLRDNVLWKSLCHTNEYSPFSSSNPLNDSLSNITDNENIPNNNNQSQNPQNSFPFTRTKSIQQSMVPVVWKNYNYKKDKVNFTSSKIPAISLWNIPWKKTFVQNWRINCNWKTGRCKVIKKESVPNTLHMAFNNNLVFSVQQGKTGVLWNIFSGETVIRVTNEDSMISAACFNENYLIIGCTNFVLKVYDLKTKELVHELNGHRGEIVSIQNDDEKIISGDENSEIKIWNIKTGLCEATLTGHDGAICALQFKNNTLVTGSVDTTIKIWDIKTKKCLMTLAGHESYVYCLKFNDQYICSGSGDNTIKTWSLKTGKCLKTLTGHEKGVVCLQFDNQKIISGSVDETIKVWNIKTGKCLYTLLHHNGSIWNLFYSNTHMISSSFDHTLCIWDFASDIY